MLVADGGEDLLFEGLSDALEEPAGLSVFEGAELLLFYFKTFGTLELEGNKFDHCAFYLLDLVNFVLERL